MNLRNAYRWLEALREYVYISFGADNMYAFPWHAMKSCLSVRIAEVISYYRYLCLKQTYDDALEQAGRNTRRFNYYDSDKYRVEVKTDMADLLKIEMIVPILWGLESFATARLHVAVIIKEMELGYWNEVGILVFDDNHIIKAYDHEGRYLRDQLVVDWITKQYSRARHLPMIMPCRRLCQSDEEEMPTFFYDIYEANNKKLEKKPVVKKAGDKVSVEGHQYTLLTPFRHGIWMAEDEVGDLEVIQIFGDDGATCYLADEQLHDLLLRAYVFYQMADC